MDKQEPVLSSKANRANRVLNASALVHKHKDQIIQQWLCRMQKKLPSAMGLPRSVLLDSLPQFLDQLVEELDTHGGNQTAVRRTARLHADQRKRLTSFPLEQLIEEYHILRMIIMEVLDLEGELSVRERDIILNCIAESLKDAAAIYSNLQIRHSSRKLHRA